ncbi:efflux RND transporter periplasmic adaptor subunit [Planctomycetota bacterium]
MKSTAIIIVIILIALAAAGYFFMRGTGQEGNMFADTFTVKRGNLKISLNEKGTLKAKESLKIATTLRGGGKIIFMVPEGAEVKEGDILVKFEREDLENKLSLEDNKGSTVQTQLETAETDLSVQIAESEKNLSSAEYKLEMAQTELEKYLKGDRIKSQREKDLKVEQSLSKMNRAKEKYQQMPDLLKEGFVTSEQVEEERLNWTTAKTEYETAVLEKELYEKYTAPMELKKYRIAVSNAETDLESTRKKTNSKLGQKRSEVEKRKMQLATAKRDYQTIIKELKKTEIKAERAGIVLYGNPEQRHWGSESFKVGSQVYPRQIIMTIPDISEMVVTFQVHEFDINKIKTDQLTYIVSDTYKGKSFEGKIIKVASVAESDSWWSRGGAKKFKMESSLDPLGTELKPGVTVRIEVLIEELQDVLFVPVQCIYVEKGKYYCFVKKSFSFERVEIKTGQSNDNYIEITEGLEEGQEVAMYEIGDFNKQDKNGKKTERE